MKYILLFVLFISSCYKEPVTYWNDAPELFDIKSFKEYNIKKGEHRSGNHFSLTLSTHVEAYVQLTETCNYELNSVDQLDINKIIGLSDAASHSDSSVRFGWRSVNNQLEIHAYIRYNGKHNSYFLGTVKPDEVFYTKIEIYPNEYRLKLRNQETRIGRESKYTGVRYKLYPYFGGNQTAPHDMLIRIKHV